MEYAIKVETLEGKVLILRRGFASQEEAEDHPIRMSHWKRVWVEAIQSSNDAVAIGKEQLDVVVEAQAGESIEVAAKGDADHVSRDLVDLLYLKLAPAWLMTNPARCARSIIQLLSIYSGVCGHGDSFGGIVCQAFSWRDYKPPHARWPNTRRAETTLVPWFRTKVKCGKCGDSRPPDRRTAELERAATQADEAGFTSDA